MKRHKQPKIITIIGHTTEIRGDISFSGGLHVDGAIIGNVIANDDTRTCITISDQGKIEGDVRVPNIIVNGIVAGDVYASERIELAMKARVSGNVYYNMLEMAMGAEVNGNLVHKTPSTEARLADNIDDVSGIEPTL